MSKPITVSTKQQRIAELAKNAPDMAMDLSHHMDVAWFSEAFRRTRKDGATGVDRVSGKEYGESLDTNIESLINRAKSGLYRAPAVRRVHIPKGDGKESRPIGIPTFEDKLLQRAVEMLVTPVFEQDFYEFSYGFRPGKSAHHALSDLREGLREIKGGHVIDLDIRSYFDTVDSKQLQGIFRKRVRDGVVCRLIGKWLNAGVMENGNLSYSKDGVPQGGVISPLLSNIYLHTVLDEWFAKVVKPLMRGKSLIVRYADDAVLAFEHKDDAERVYKVLSKRFAKFGLALHEEKTRLLDFCRDSENRESFDFLGFTHFWAKSRKGNQIIKRKTAKKRFARATKELSQWLKRVRHQPITWQHRLLSMKLRGHYNYYGITGNSYALARFAYCAYRLWFFWLQRRSRAARRTWEWYRDLLDRLPLPRAIAVHSILRQ